MIEAKIIKDSVAPSGIRLTTFVLKYPRFIHPEFMTHRMFSRNASSSRAIPVKKQLRSIRAMPAIPVHWGRNRKGMQSYIEVQGFKLWLGKKIWHTACIAACFFAGILRRLGFHKQLVNRIVEPFMHISVVCTGTNEAYSNFFALRNHHAAQPEIKELARDMWNEYVFSKPQELKEGEWHLPFVNMTEDLSWEDMVKKSIACCARVSYKNHDKTDPTPEQNSRLYDRLLKERPIHASPSEHQARAEKTRVVSGNFVGWTQFRKTLEGEYITEFREG